jgi:hypothetical protein
VPASITTVNGNGFTISASDIDVPPIPQFNGAILTNAGPGQTMNIENLTVSGPTTGFQVCTNSGNVLYGIYFNDATGSVGNNVTVEHIWQQPNLSLAPSCNAGTAIRVQNLAAAGTVTITNTTVVDYQKNGIDGRGSTTTMDVSGSTIGPPNNQEGLIAANGLVYVSGATGTAMNNTIFGSGDQQLPGPPGGGTDATAVLLSGATNVTITHNIITGAKVDIGVAVAGDSTGNVISFNQIGRTSPDVPDPTGHGIDVFTPDGSSATPICNTFTMWNINIVGAEQIACTSLPPGTECQAYSATTPTVDSGMNWNVAGDTIIDATPFTWTVDSGTLPPGLSLSSGGAFTGIPTAAGAFNFTLKLVDSTGLTATQAQTITIAPGSCTVPVAPDYRLVGQDGGVFVFGDSSFDGSLPGVPEYSKPIVGAAVTSTGNGYWMVGNDGSLFAFGDANFFGGLFGQPLTAPIVGMASPNDGGYWMAGADGSVYAFGDAPFLGSLFGTPLAAPIVGIASTPDGNGYWLVGADGGIFAFGDAGFFGSLPSSGIAPATPVVGMSPTHDGMGYWLVAADGGVFAFGDAGFFGSATNLPLAAPIVGIVGSPDDGGYWLMGADGGVFAYGDAPFLGSMVSLPHIGPITSAIP